MLYPVGALPLKVQMLMFEMDISHQRIDVIPTNQVILGFHPSERAAGRCFCSIYLLQSGRMSTMYPEGDLDHVVKQIPRGSLIIKGTIGRTASLYIPIEDEKELAQ